MLKISKFILIFTDLISLIISAILSFHLIQGITHKIWLYIPIEQVSNRLFIHIILSLFAVAWFWLRLRHYTYRKPFWFELKEIIRTLIIISIIELAIISFSKLYFSRTLWLLTWLFAFMLVPLCRILVKKLLIRKGWYLKNTVIIGTGQNAIEAYNALTKEKYLGFNITYFVKTDLELSNNLPLSTIDEDLLWKKIDYQNTQFILALEHGRADLLEYWVRLLSRKNCRSVSVIPSLRGLPLYSTDMSFLFSHDVMLLRINNNLAKRSSRCLKRLVDIVAAALIIVISSPLLLILYYLIRKDGGNAIYGHQRIGRNGEPFKCLKFRTMVVNSQQVLDELLAKNPEARKEWQQDFKLKNDPRITKVGHFLRKTSLDELPQLFNVLKGEMSLVGPRPIVQQELQRYQGNVDYYLMAKPGMTGLWQVSGRNDIDYAQRVYLDAWYVKNWSLWIDFVILCKTVRVVLKRDGAY